jgi:hypothetical protein
MKSKFYCLTLNIAIVLTLSLISFCNAQNVPKPDVVILKDNTKLEVLIQEVDDNVIKYKKLKDQEGPIFTIKKSSIASVLYGNGEVETFTQASSEVFFDKDNNVKPVESVSAQPFPKNKFEETMYGYKPNQLRKAYQFYKSKSKRGLVSGIVWTSLGTIAMGVGTVLLMDEDNNKYYSYNKNAETGAVLVLAGLVGGATFGTIGFVKAGRNGSKASKIRKELTRRGEPLTFSLKPGYNPSTNAGYLSLKVAF